MKCLDLNYKALNVTDHRGEKCVESGSIPNMGEVPMEAAILAHVHPLGLSFKPGGGQALPLPTVNLPTLYSLLHMSKYVQDVAMFLDFLRI